MACLVQAPTRVSSVVPITQCFIAMSWCTPPPAKMTTHDIVPYNMTTHDIVQYNMTTHDIVQYSLTIHDIVKYYNIMALLSKPTKSTGEIM